jgi:hypothetical protein
LGSDWDSLKVGCGPPPIKTKEGWLLIYQAVCKLDGSCYKIGAMLLDLKDPTKVLARTRSPILEPIANYENEGWKAGVVYPCGAVIIKDRLFVYYGGADTVVCVATAKLQQFLEHLAKDHKESKPESMPAHPSNINDELRGPIQGYCMKCRRMREIKNPRYVILNMRHVIQGICPWCGGKISRFIKSRSDIDEDTLLSRVKKKGIKKQNK